MTNKQLWKLVDRASDLALKEGLDAADAGCAVQCALGVIEYLKKGDINMVFAAIRNAKKFQDDVWAKKEAA